MGEKEEVITLPLRLLQDLVLAVEPFGMTQAILNLQGLGRTTDHGLDGLWVWDRTRVKALNEEELIKVINELIWK